MKPLPKRVALGALAAGLLAVGGYAWLDGRASAPPSAPPYLATDTVAAREAIADPLLSELLADDYGDAEELEYYDRDAARQALLAEQPRATGKRAVAVAYLLAALDEDYARNRDIVLAALEARLNDPTDDDDAIEYAIALCRRGDQAFRRPLLAAAMRCVDEAAARLSAFYAELITSDMDGFLDALSGFKAPEQQRIAALMAETLVVAPEDQVSDEAFDDLFKRLEERAKRGKPGLRAAAKHCLAALERELSEEGTAIPSQLARAAE